MAGSQTISTSETRIESLKLQSSAYGVTIPVVGGVTRIAGNLIYYTDFKAIPHTSTQGSGKGGGVKTQNTTYTYQAGVIMGLCQGLIKDVLRIWKGKQRFETVTRQTLVTVSETFTVPIAGGSVTVAHAAQFANNLEVSGNAENPNREGGSGFDPTVFAEGSDYSVSAGTYTFPANAGRDTGITIRYQYASAPSTQTAMQQLGVTLVKGDQVQAAPSWVNSLHASEALSYPLLAYVHAQAYELGQGAQVENHNFEVSGYGSYSVSASIPDCDPSDFTFYVLTNETFGARMPGWAITSFARWSDYCIAAGLLFSPALTEQLSAAELTSLMAKLTNAAPFWDVDHLEVVPYADQAVTGNGKTYTPNVTPVYDLTNDHFLANVGETPVTVRRKLPSDCFNHVRLQFRNRANYYNEEIAEAKDQADIEANGLRSMPIIKSDWIVDAAVARRVAQLVLQRSVNVAAEYDFKLPWAFDMLQLMDLVTLTEPTQLLNKKTVRIIALEEDEYGRLAVTAEDFPEGVATAALYPSQESAGYQHDYNAAPGSVSAPVLFEAPAVLTASGLEVWAAVRGTGAYWGGCNVWVSFDGTNYSKVQTLYGGARYGQLTGPINVGVLPVSLVGGQLLNGTAADAAALSTLCYIGGAVQEYVAYTTATLTGTNAYNVSGLVRGAYGTSGANAHAAGNPFVRCDDALAKSGPLDLSMVGKTIYFKFTSFNVFGGGEESLASVAAYSYSVSGAMYAVSSAGAQSYRQESAPAAPVALGSIWTKPSTGDQKRWNGASWELYATIGANVGNTSPAEFTEAQTSIPSTDLISTGTSGGDITTTIHTQSYTNNTGGPITVQTEDVARADVAWNLAYPEIAKVWLDYSISGGASGSLDLIPKAGDGLSAPLQTPGAITPAFSVPDGATLTVAMKARLKHTKAAVLGWYEAQQRMTAIKR